MATVAEHFAGRSFTDGPNQVTELTVDIHDAANESAARGALQLWAPATYDGRYLEDWNVREVGNGLWNGTLRYTLNASDDEYTFSTGGGTQHITQSLETVSTYAPSGLTAPDFEGAIGVSGDRVEGVDIPVRTYQFSETHRFTDTFVASGFKLTLFTLTGCYNNATFKGFAAGECMFLGATGSKRGVDAWSITFNFACTPNISGATVGSITGISKLGWHHLWIRYADYVDGFAYCLVPRPIAAYVERVAEPADFSDLSIGT